MSLQQQFNGLLNGVSIGISKNNTNTNTRLGANNPLQNTVTNTNTTALGYSALSNLSEGNNNTAIGSTVMSSMMTGSGNSAIGFNALGSATSSVNNVALGSSAMRLAQTPSPFNTVIGAGAMMSSTNPGTRNTIVGGYNSVAAGFTGSYNTVLGAYAGTTLTSGNSNVLVGDSAGQGLTTGNNNVLLGTPNLGNIGNVFAVGSSIYGSGLNSAGAFDLSIDGSVRAISFTGTSIYVNELDTSSSVLNIGVTSNPKTINIGHPLDTVNVIGTLTYVNSTVTQLADPQLVLNQNGYFINGAGLIIFQTGSAGTGAYILVNNASDAWTLKAGSGPLVTLNQNISTSSAVTFADILPYANNAYSLGSTGMLWHSLYVGTGSVHIGANVVLSSPDNTRLTLNSDLVPSNLNLNLGSLSVPWKSIYVSTGSVFIGPTGTLQIDNNGVISSVGGFAAPTVAIGSTTPGNGITLYTSVNKLYYKDQFGSSGPVSVFNVASNNVNNAYIATGNLGIGTNSPSYLLDVNGDIHTTGNVIFRSGGNTGYIGGDSSNTGLFTNMIHESTGNQVVYYSKNRQEIVYSENKYLQAYDTTTQNPGTSWTGVKFNHCPLNSGWTFATGSSIFTGTFNTSAVYNVIFTASVHENENAAQTFASYIDLDGIPVQGSMKSISISTNGTEYTFVNNFLLNIPVGTHSIEILMNSTKSSVTVQSPSNITPVDSTGSGASLIIVKVA